MQICTSYGSTAAGSPPIMSNAAQLLENPVAQPYLTVQLSASLHLTIPLTIPSGTDFISVLEIFLRFLVLSCVVVISMVKL
ncbi:hypothetical protein [Chryseobacterium aureum]|uniref:hypothetical protein n=1 Tax=Chryseobacterium aureum TaxID=2497456 RepID=UPI000F87E95A|nr:hypothetical protein [Chryseobacterium aureum]